MRLVMHAFFERRVTMTCFCARGVLMMVAFLAVQAEKAVEVLLELAEEMYSWPIEVITSKKVTPPTGDKRTYVSLATYCWPANPEDLEHPKGPWECRDGTPFPGRHVIAPDFMMLMRLQSRVYTLSTAYYFTRDERYAQKAAEAIRAFFLNKETGMLPNLVYAQLKPSFTQGAPTGTIDMFNIYTVFDSVRMLEGSRHWAPVDTAAMHDWTAAYLGHLNDPHTRPERCSTNNHGTWYDVQYLSVLVHLGRIETATRYVDEVVKPRLRLQIQASMLPNELIRPKSYAYVNFELMAFARLGLLGDNVGIDLWSFQAESRNSILVRDVATGACVLRPPDLTKTCEIFRFVISESKESELGFGAISRRARAQDAWDWMGPHLCDRSLTMWPVEQMDDPPLDLQWPALWMGAAYTRVARGDGRYNERSLSYAQLWHQLRSGHDPHCEVEWDKAIASNLMLAYVDDCFFELCTEGYVRSGSPRTYAAACAPVGEPPSALCSAFDTPRLASGGLLGSLSMWTSTTDSRGAAPFPAVQLLIMLVALTAVFVTSRVARSRAALAQGTRTTEGVHIHA